MTETAPEWMPRLWRFELAPTPELGLAFARHKRRFWAPTLKLMAASCVREIVVRQDDPIVERVFKKAEARYGMMLPHRDGHPDNDYDSTLVANMDHRTPQFNLRNVERVEKQADPTEIEWTPTQVPDRHGFTKDLDEVRAAKHEPPVFQDDLYSTTTLHGWMALYREIFRENDWEKWYGAENKRTSGALWRHVPADGGKRTRPWEAVKVVPYRYWRGRLM